MTLVYIILFINILSVDINFNCFQLYYLFEIIIYINFIFNVIS